MARSSNRMRNGFQNAEGAEKGAGAMGAGQDESCTGSKACLAGQRRSRFTASLREGGRLVVAAALQVGEEIEDLVLRQRRDQPGGISETGEASFFTMLPLGMFCFVPLNGSTMSVTR